MKSLYSRILRKFFPGVLWVAPHFLPAFLWARFLNLLWLPIAIRNARLINSYADQPHVMHSWAKALDGRYLKRMVTLPKLTSHAPWLNGEALALRSSLGRPTVDGFYIA